MILYFRGDYDFLSNFYETPIEYDGFTFRNTEGAFQAGKCYFRKDVEKLQHMDGATAKAYARKMGKITEEEWFYNNVNIMFQVNWIKYSNPELRAKLLATGNHHLIEGNRHRDDFWGCCKEPLENTNGRNYLGKVLMMVRFYINLGVTTPPTFVTRAGVDQFYEAIKDTLV